ncbi:hypothetical protein COY27_02490 [Candidatus Woesearchaeota archaeon CG_4_10_14_0_2_um_filter_33_13]|nr:MAG: hypothetical protein COY27_02490 [Candidatus Woesearchaeota archaeon CG_4_10_14_0_2_um_filter_33_13]
MEPKRIRLYHGGHIDKVLNIGLWGLNQNTPFYCTRDKALAEEAEYSHGLEGALLSLEVPEEVFHKCINAGYWTERPYVGCIPIEYSKEVIINLGVGIEIMNEIIAAKKKTF